MNKLILIFSIILFTGCSAKLLVPVQADVDRVAEKYQGYTLAELNEGKSIYEQQCDGCHGLNRPQSRNEKAWNKIVPEMVEKVNKKAGKEEIDQKEQETLLKYLVTMSMAPKR